MLGTGLGPADGPDGMRCTVDFTASNGGDGGSYERPKPGSYYGVLIGVADIGTHTGQFGAKRKVMLRWELHKRKGPMLDTAGHPLTVVAQYNQSFDVKSSLRQVIEAHMGKIPDGSRVSSREWLNRAARLVLKETDDQKYTNVETVTPLDPDEDPVVKAQSPLEHWEFSDPSLPPMWCKRSVEKSQEWQSVNSKSSRPTPAQTAAVGAEDNEIPF